MPKVTVAGGTPAIVPLSLLEALRNLDTPVGDGLDELAGEIVAKRFGLSSTVAAQIQRYQDAHRRGLPVPADETVGVFRLVGRRPDSALVYADAGRRAALFDEISALGLQAVMTGTERSLFAALEGRATFVRVSGGGFETD